MFTLKNMLFKRIYHYTPLETNHIRLLKLFPGKHKAPISCSLLSVNLLDYDDDTARSDNAGLETFDALSYTWGDPKKTTPIICDGRIVHVTINLRDALVCLRDIKKAHILWADALCINQRDVKEREEQVKLMGLIYWKARHVHIWLGRDDTDDPVLNAWHAADLMQKLGQLWVESTTMGSPSYSLKLHGLDSYLVMHNNEWISTQRVLDRPWFQRVWVVQELGLARDATFYCGDESFSQLTLNRFVRFMDAQGTLFKRVHDMNFKMIHMTDQYKKSTRGGHRDKLGSDPDIAESFLDVLHSSRGLACTDPRDSVYAFLGHPAAFKQQRLDGAPYESYPRNYYHKKGSIIKPDYRDTNTFLDVYASIAVACIEKLDIGFDILSYITHDEESIEKNYPSWVPRWDITSSFSSNWRKDIFYAASGTHSPSLVKVLHQHPHSARLRLELKAKFLGCVKSAEDLASDSYSSLRSLIERMHSEDPVSIAVAFTAGLSMGTDLLYHPAEDDLNQHYHNFQAFMRQEESTHVDLISTPSYDSDSAKESEPGAADYYGITLMKLASKRAFFKTEDNRIGLGPRISREGDEVWLPMGARVPFVFRRVGKKLFKILGQAYLHGVMRGEAVKNLTADDFPLITLC